MEIIQKNGYRLTLDAGGSYKVGSVDGEEMPLVTFDANLAINHFVSLVNKKPPATVTAGSREKY